jgi:transcriptional regulator NrdR family protein
MSSIKNLSTFDSLTKSDGTIKPFYREHLLMSIMDATKHLTSNFETSIALTDTICGTLLASKRLQLSTNDIVSQTALVLKRFDHSAYLRYITLHQR